MKKKTKSLLATILAVIAVLAMSCFVGCVDDMPDDSGSSPIDSNPTVVYNVTAPATSDKYTFTGEATVNEGEDYLFTVVKANGLLGNLTVTAKMGESEVEVEETENGYKIASVNGNIVISVVYNTKEFTVTAPATSDKYTFTGEATVNEGEDYLFTVEKATGLLGNLTVTAKMGEAEVEVEETENGYKISSVNGNIVISVSYKEKTYTVVKQACEGASIVGEDKAIAGQEYVFEVTLEEGYEKGTEYGVLVNGAEVTTAEDGKYHVSDFTSGFVVEVKGVVECTFTATYTVEGVDASAIDKTEETFNYSAQKYTITFNVTANYDNSKDLARVFVKIGDGEEQEVVKADGAYVIDNPKADITVIIKGLELNKYDVYFVLDGDVFYSLEDVSLGSKITQDMLNDVAAILENQGLYKVFGWNNLPEEVSGTTVITPVISPKTVIHSNGWDDKDCTGKTVNGGSDADWTVTDEVTAPQGFESVMKMTSGFNNNGKNYLHGRYSHDNISMYSYITFAAKSNGVFNIDTGATGGVANITTNDWVVYTLTKNGTIWHINIKCGDEVVADFDDNAARTNICDILWHGRATGTNISQGEEDLVIYSTEVRAVFDFSAITLEEITQKIIVDAEKVDEVAPTGFMNVYHYVADSAPAAQTMKANVSDVDISAYEYLEFYAKCTTSWILFDGWSHTFESNGAWTKVEAVKNSDTQWTVTFAGKSTTVTKETAITKLSEILTFEMDMRDSSMEGSTVEGCSPSQIYLTELRGRKPVTPAQPKGTVVSDCTYKSTTDAIINMIKATETAPAGFESVYSYKSAPKTAGVECFAHGMFFARDDISAYSEVYFAMKLNGVLQLDGPRKSLGEGWLTFKLTQNEDGTWNLSVVNEAGETVYSAESLSGDSVWKILWSERTLGYCPMMEIDGLSLRVSVTELRGTLKA